MSTRATIHFQYEKDGGAGAIVYRHSDGYPDGLGEDLKKFVKAVKEQCGGYSGGTRFNDPSYLAVKWIVFDAAGHMGDANKPLDFLGVGVVMDDPGDIEYRYHVYPNADATDIVIDCEEI